MKLLRDAFLVLTIFLAFQLHNIAGAVSRAHPLCHDCRTDTLGYISFDDIYAEMQIWPLGITFSKRFDDDLFLIAGVHLIIINSENIIVFNDVIDAPFFVALIPPGIYRLIGTYDEIRIHQEFEIISDANLIITLNWS